MSRKKHPRDLLKERRIKSGLSIAKLAAMVGYDAATWSRIESGAIATINPVVYESAMSAIKHYEEQKEVR